MNERDYRLGQGLLSSPGWEGWLRPMIEQEVAQTESTQGLTPEERPAPKFSDEFLRGYRRGLLFVTLRPGRLLREYEAEHDRQAVDPDPPGQGDPYRDSTLKP